MDCFMMKSLQILIFYPYFENTLLQKLALVMNRLQRYCFLSLCALYAYLIWSTKKNKESVVLLLTSCMLMSNTGIFTLHIQTFHKTVLAYVGLYYTISNEVIKNKQKIQQLFENYRVFECSLIRTKKIFTSTFSYILIVFFVLFNIVYEFLNRSLGIQFICFYMSSLVLTICFIILHQTSRIDDILNCMGKAISDKVNVMSDVDVLSFVKLYQLLQNSVDLTNEIFQTSLKLITFKFIFTLVVDIFYLHLLMFSYSPEAKEPSGGYIIAGHLNNFLVFNFVS